MPEIKRKVFLEARGVLTTPAYIVTKTLNLTRPEIGERLTEEEVNKLIASGIDVTIE
jgi:ethanolamine ammonia-lyase small subunit